jgi:hypothetical protein
MVNIIRTENSTALIDRALLAVADGNAWLEAAAKRFAKANALIAEENAERARKGLPAIPLIPSVAPVELPVAGEAAEAAEASEPAEPAEPAAGDPPGTPHWDDEPEPPNAG